MRDLIPRGDRSIRNIPVPANHRRPVARPPEEEYEEQVETPQPRRVKRRQGGRWFLWVAIVIIILCAIGGVLLATLFAGATVSVTPRSASVTAPPTMNAALHPAPGGLAFSTITTSRSATVTVKTNGTQQVSRAGSGMLTITNNYSIADQRLIPNTRFEAPDGKIYKIHEAINVPGQTTASDGTVTPGTASIIVYAESPGSDYNRGATTFTIPGFKGDPRYTKFSAQADSISGGLVGPAPAIAPSDLTTAENSLKQGLLSAINDAVATQVPKEFIALPGTLTIVYNDVSQTMGTDGSASLGQTATAGADVVRASDLAAAIAKVTVQGYAGEAVNFADPAAITLGLASTTKQPANTLQLTLSGSPTLLWQFDPNALQAALVGKNKSAFEEIVKSFAPAITCTKETPCSASIRPFWSSTFSSDPDKIKINAGQAK